MSYTLGQAAKAVGKTKPTILRAIKGGKISAVKDEASGEWRIEPAELHRVYQPASIEVTPKPATENGLSYNALQVEVTLLRERVTAQETLIRERLADKDAMIAELRDDRDQWREQAQRLAITDQRAKAPEVTPPATSEAIITPPPPAADPAPAITPTPAPETPSTRPNAALVAVKVRPVKKPPAKETGWFRRMMGGR
jgi:hypothetical protein